MGWDEIWGGSGGKDGAVLASGPGLYRAVVIEVLNDMSAWPDKDDDSTEYSIEDYADIANLRLLESAPRDSVLARVVTDGYDKKGNGKAVVCYPFFPPHLSLPMKPGEQCWIYIEDSAGPAAIHGYWMCRVTGPLWVDDVNFTHLSRAVVYSSSPKETQEAAWEASGDDIVDPETRGVDFPNGLDVDEEYLLNDSPDAFEEIFADARANQSITYEPVPRFTKRPGDLVIQGSNNTLICLGEDRGYAKDIATEVADAVASSALNSGASLAHLGAVGQTIEEAPADGVQPPNERTRAGSIDIVAGRGRFLPEPDKKSESTAPRIIENSRKYLEVDKNPVGAGQEELAQPGDVKENRLENPAEGDPDFHNDASRIYVSMNTLPDINFALEYPQVPVAGDANDGADIEILEKLAKGIGQAAIIMKSDEVRIIARQEPLDDDPGPTGLGNAGTIANGSIKIIKEGVADDEEGKGRACIIMQPDGVIMIDGPKIVLGSGIEKDNGEGAQVSIGLAANDEPMVLGAQLLGILSAIIDVLDNHIHPSGAGPTSPRAGGNEATAIGGFSNTGDNITDLKLMLSKVGKLL